jgi:hypothetical protein
MLIALALFAGFALLMLLMGWASAETRPGFLDPNARLQPFTAPIPPHPHEPRY